MSANKLRLELPLQRLAQLRVIVLSFALLGLVGCATPGGAPFDAGLHQPRYAPFERQVVLETSTPLPTQIDAALAGIERDGLQITLEYGPEVGEARRADAQQVLLRTGMRESAIRLASGGKGNELNLVLRRTRAHAGACAELAAGASDGKWYGSGGLDARYGCSVNANLAAQLVYPEDAREGGTLGAANPVRAVSAVEAYQRGKVRELNTQKMEVGGGDSGPM